MINDTVIRLSMFFIKCFIPMQSQRCDYYMYTVWQLLMYPIEWPDLTFKYYYYYYYLNSPVIAM